VSNKTQRRGPVFEMTLRNVVWPFFEREGRCASCGDAIGDAPEALLCVDCASDVRNAKREASAVFEEIIDLG
jgi:hypothetical protein